MKIVNFFINHYKILILICILSLIFGNYLRVLNFGFINDDFDLVGKSLDEVIKSSIYGMHFRPIWYFSFFLIDYIFSPGAFAHHFTNITLHLINLIFAYHIFKKLFDKQKALLIVFFWTFLPQLVFQIVWISGKNDLLMNFFILLSFHLALNNKIKTSLAIYFLAFLAKVTCIFYPLIYLVKFGFGFSKKIKIISFILLIVTLLITIFSTLQGQLQPHIAELSFPIRILNHIKNFIVGWITLFFPIPFFPNFFIALLYLIFISTVFFIIYRSFKIHRFSLLLMMICFVISITLSINYQLRITYTLSLFLVATLISFIDFNKLNLLSYNKFLKIIIFLFFLIYGASSSVLTTNKFKSNQFDISGEMYIMNDFYLNDFYGKFRSFQIKILKDNNIK